VKNSLKNIAVVVLAAGAGTRMKSSVPKILHEIFGKPIIQYVLDSVKGLGAETNIIVLSPQTKEVENILKDYPLRFVYQEKPLGTADALKISRRYLKGFKGSVLVLNGDTPLVETETLKNLIKLHKENKEDISFISFIVNGEHSYGRVVRHGKRVMGIVEDKDATERQKDINEVNSGIYAIRSELLKLLDDVKINEKKREYYLTDIVKIAVDKGYKVSAHILSSERELTGVNKRIDLHNAGIYLRDKIVDRWMDRGVTFVDRNSVFIHPDVKIGMDTVIYPNVYIEGNTRIGNNCVIFPGARVTDSIIGDNAVIRDYTVIESSTIGDNTSVGPFAHIRPGSTIGHSVKIGNFVEVKKSVIGEGTKASHLSYLGDAEIGRNVNIGAGTITCNYDGREKHKTVIEDNVFIGSDTQLIAPVRVGKGAYVGAGSTITKEVPAESLGISRTPQKNIMGWAKKKLINKKNQT
jgi:bifunctional UDP-N-acetylglucosamine pyrophosphorylase/glucosamine-1-phosphate N-acetyltransferase